MAQERRSSSLPRAALTLALATALAVSFASSASARSAHPAPRSAVAYDYVAAKARELGSDPQAIVQFVRDDVKPDTSYTGVLRGAVGTLWAGAGDDADRALLLRALLRGAHARTRLVHGAVYGVEIANSSGSFDYAGPAAQEDASAAPVARIPDTEFHTVGVTVRTIDASGATSNKTASFRAADLAGQDLHVFYERAGAKTVAVISGPGRQTRATADAAHAKSQELVIRLHGPGADDVERHRELFTTGFTDYPSLFDPSNRYDVTVTTGWIPDTVSAREVRLAHARAKGASLSSAAQLDGTTHVLAYTFLAQSDANTAGLMTQQSVNASIASPRVTVVANEAQRSGKRVVARSLSFDLVKNDLAVAGDPDAGISFNTSNSLYDGSLELQVLQAVTGRVGMSAADALAAAGEQLHATAPERTAVLGRALARLLSDEAVQGASLSVSPSGLDSYWIRYTRDRDRVQVSASDAVTQALAGAPAAVRGLLTARLRDSDIPTAALTSEVALATAGKLPPDFEAVYSYDSQLTKRWYENAHVFSYSNFGDQLRLTFESQIAQLSPDVVFDSIDYFDEVNGQFQDPQTVSITNSKADLDDSDTFTTWYRGGSDTSTGRTFDMISRKAYRELDKSGSTLLRWKYSDDTTSDPIRFSVVGRSTEGMTLDNRQVDVDVLVIRGGYDKDQIPPGTTPPDIVDPGDGSTINEWVVLADPDFPLLVSGGMRVQSAITGRVTDASTGRGVPDATVTVQGADASGTTWPDGQFSLLLGSHPLGQFDVTVDAAGYDSLTVNRDLTVDGALPLSLQLNPTALDAQHGAAWIDHDNLETALPATSLSDRAKAVMTAAIQADDAIAFAIPSAPVTYPLGATEAWIEMNTRTGEMYPQFRDGLHGASTLRGLTSDAAASLSGFAGKGRDFVIGKAKDFVNKNIDKPFDPGQAAVGAPLAYYAGNIAGWYLFAAGALDAVGTPGVNTNICDIHTHTVTTAKQLLEFGWTTTAEQFGVSTAGGAAGGFVPYLNGKLVNAAFKQGALHAIALLAAVSAQDWGLAQRC